MTVTILLVALLFHFIKKIVSITIQLGTFKFGARGFTVVSACAGGLVIKLSDMHISNIVITRRLSKSLRCLSPTKNSDFISAPRQQANGSVFVDLSGFAVGPVAVLPSFSWTRTA